MDSFLARHRAVVTSVLSGFDRLVFRGTLLSLVMPMGMYSFLTRAGVLLVDFKKYVDATTERDKGLICAFKTLEPCMSFEYHRSSDRSERGLRLVPRKCLHIYKYYLHPLFGFIGARLQTWFPFTIQICINGREWLAWDLSKRRRTDFRRDDNCFPELGDPKLAQKLMDRQLTVAWPRALGGIARDLNPLHEDIFRCWSRSSYYWSAYQSEWATDIMFRDPASLAAVYPALVRHATLHFQSPDVMRFLGRKPHGNFTGQVVSSFKNRPEGVRVKHWVKGNSIKMYDKGGNLLRVETTLGNPKDFKVLRPRHDLPNGPLEWRPLRKGVADLHRRAQVSQQSNANYLDALAAVEDPIPERPGNPGCTNAVRTALESCYRERAAQRVPERVQAWVRKVAVPVPEVVIRDQQKRWGSCDRRGVVRFNWRVIQAPAALVDYVVAHELVHLRERGHSKEFWALLGKVMPEYERRREELRRIGPRLEW